ncbi:MAG: hypothetical protein COA67_09870 [Lutibacter sp.]|nr:MAG: hypothetical protein COA67_09870 [Lutibacter sp.]
MKTSLLKLSVIAVIFSMITFVSCDTNDDGIDSAEQVSSVDIAANDEVDMAVEEVNNIIEQAFVEEESGLTTSKQNEGNSFFTNCLTKTVVITNLSKIVTLDFGEGCMVRGHFIAGILTMSYEKDTTLQTRTISVEFDDFRVNHKLIVGAYSIVRMRANEIGNPQSTATIDINVTWDNGDFASREGVKIREWIEGYGSGIWSDNVYLITGNWTSVLKNGNVLSAEITTPLRRELVCRFFVSGEIALQKNNRTATLSFGDGNCDNEALLTLQNGTEIIIYLS